MHCISPRQITHLLSSFQYKMRLHMNAGIDITGSHIKTFIAPSKALPVGKDATLVVFLYSRFFHHGVLWSEI